MNAMDAGIQEFIAHINDLSVMMIPCWEILLFRQHINVL